MVKKENLIGLFKKVVGGFGGFDGWTHRPNTDQNTDLDEFVSHGVGDHFLLCE